MGFVDENRSLALIVIANPPAVGCGNPMNNAGIVVELFCSELFPWDCHENPLLKTPVDFLAMTILSQVEERVKRG